jgi:hypothetical protein
VLRVPTHLAKRLFVIVVTLEPAEFEWAHG